MKIYLKITIHLISGLVLTWLISVWVFFNMIDLFCLDGQEGAGMFGAVGVSVGDPHSYAVHLSQYCNQVMQLCQKTHSSVFLLLLFFAISVSARHFHIACEKVLFSIQLNKFE